ncbi:MAG: domain S-box protein [Bacteroidota bacterium]|nr:domain S-box protein [Bacteroidota bacterium]
MNINDPRVINPDKLKILVVDDNDDDLFMICEYLSGIDTYKIKAEGEVNYKQARKKILQNEHDIYIIDYFLGAETGLELIKECTKAGIGKPFILLTGKGDKQVDVAAAKAGVYDYITKSELNTELLERSLRYSMHRYLAYSAVEESEKRYREIFSKSNDIIFVLDKTFRFLNFNPALTRILGYEFDEIHGKPIAVLFESSEQAGKFLHHLEFSGSDIDFEMVLFTKAKIGKTFLASFSRITLLDGSAQYQAILYDYTNLKKSMAEKLLNAKIEATGKLVRSLAHEIRNPLTNINLSVHQLKMDIPEDKEVFIDIVERNSGRISDLINKLVNLSNPQENGSEKIDIKQIIQHSLSNALDRIKLKKIEVIESHTPDNPFIVGDKLKMQMAASNIIINAVEAVQNEEGKLWIETLYDNNIATIKITDNGAGIPAENIGHLFQPFFTGKKNGMGLGLAIAHSVIKAHNGSIDVESTPGEGCTFIIRLKTSSM